MAEVYVEYAFAENLLIDGMLLCLACRFTRRAIRWLPIVGAASFGAAFACVYALFSVQKYLSFLIKSGAGLIICAVACAEKMRRGEKNGARKKVAKFRDFLRFSAVFFVLSACLCGVFYALDIGKSRIRAWQIPVCAFFFAASLRVAKRIFLAKKIAACCRKCVILAGENRRECVGFVDTGNRAKSADGAPLCFLSPETALGLIDEKSLGKEMRIGTVNGEKKIVGFPCSVLLYDGKIEHRIEKAYFVPSPHVRGNEYSAVLPADCWLERSENAD